MEMKAGGFLNTGTDLANTDFAAIAEGAGIFSIRVENSEEIPDALRRAFAEPGPAVVSRPSMSWPCRPRSNGPKLKVSASI
jgi:pyruvate dehydrogenase (quinone)